MDKENIIKIIVVGDGNVGKTSLINQYLYKEFKENYPSTVAGDKSFHKLKIDDEEYTIQLWDTAGQEIYRNVNKLFFKNSNIVIFVYDITSKSSYENILKYWYDEIMSILKKEDIVCGIAGNKVDLYEKEKVNFEEVKKYAKSIGAYAKETSAKNYESINHLIQFLVKKYISISDKNEIKKGFQLSIPETNPSSSCSLINEI